jgi:hypothetical protein
VCRCVGASGELIAALMQGFADEWQRDYAAGSQGGLRFLLQYWAAVHRCREAAGAFSAPATGRKERGECLSAYCQVLAWRRIPAWCTPAAGRSRPKRVGRANLYLPFCTIFNVPVRSAAAWCTARAAGCRANTITGHAGAASRYCGVAAAAGGCAGGRGGARRSQRSKTRGAPPGVLSAPRGEEVITHCWALFE